MIFRFIPMNPYLVGVLVEHVEGVTGEPGTTTAVAVNQVRVLVTCTEIRDELEFTKEHENSQSELRGVGHTGDLPDQIVGDV
jgi:hypothetical protein